MIQHRLSSHRRLGFPQHSFRRISMRHDNTLSERGGEPKDTLVVPFDRYEILGELGCGGMGAVYLATERMPSGATRHVALKVIRNDVPNAPKLQAMFSSEANLLVEANHPHVVNVYA